MSDDTRPEDTRSEDARASRLMLTGLSPRARGRLRSGATLTVLVVLLLVAVGVGFAALTSPFGSAEDSTSVCTDTTFAEGDEVRPADVTVSVLNAGGRNGLASRTLDDLENAGFDRGQLDNAPDDTEVRGVQIWTSDRRNPAVRLVRSHLGGRVLLRDLDSDVAGVTVVVGDAFAGAKQGRRSIVAGEDAEVCGPGTRTLS